MKIIHTSDWHLGQNFYNYDRNAEQENFLQQLCDIVKEEQPDVLVVSGDIYDSLVPSISAQKLYYKMMLKIHNSYPEMHIVVTAGNHDSSSRLELTSELWAAFGLNVIGNVERCDNEVMYDKHIIEIRDKSKQLSGYVIAVPYIHESNFPPCSDETQNRTLYFFQTLLDRVSQRNTNNLPVILMAHIAVEGVNMEGPEKGKSHLSYSDLSLLGCGYDYLALGHIHCPQTLKNSNNRARYCGSPLPISFDENYPHSITIVNLSQHLAEPQISILPIHNLMPILNIPKQEGELPEVLEQLNQLPNDKNGYIRVNLLITDVMPRDAREKIDAIVKHKMYKLCYIKPYYPAILSSDKQENLTQQELQKMNPLFIAKEYYKSHSNGLEMNEELEKRMQSVINKTLHTNL